MKARALPIFLFLFVLSACGSPFAPIVLAPGDVQIIDFPATLPDSLKPLYILWSGGLVPLGGSGITAYPHPGASFGDVSDDGKLITYVVAPVVKGEKGLPYVEDRQLAVYDVHLQKRTILVSKNRQFPDAVLLDAPAFTPDGKQIVFLVAWENEMDLAKVDIHSGEVQRLNVNVMLTNFVHPDVSRDGYIVVICRGPRPQSSELCLLDEKGKLIRYLTEEGYPWPGRGLFTPDGQYVVYESRFKLYKVRIDGSERQQIAPCSAGVQAVTDDYAVTACYVSQEPDCLALFVASLDGSDFRRIGYIEPYCVSEK